MSGVFLGTLYLEHVMHLSALRTGLAFLSWSCARRPAQPPHRSDAADRPVPLPWTCDD